MEFTNRMTGSSPIENSNESTRSSPKPHVAESAYTEEEGAKRQIVVKAPKRSYRRRKKVDASGKKAPRSRLPWRTGSVKEKRGWTHAGKRGKRYMITRGDRRKNPQNASKERKELLAEMVRTLGKTSMEVPTTQPKKEGQNVGEWSPHMTVYLRCHRLHCLQKANSNQQSGSREGSTCLTARAKHTRKGGKGTQGLKMPDFIDRAENRPIATPKQSSCVCHEIG